MIQNCKALRALPRPGGVFDQDSFFMHMFTVYEVAVGEKQELENQRAEAKRRRLQGK